MADLDYADFDSEEAEFAIGVFVEPVEGAAELFAEVGGDPDDGGGVEAGGVDQALSEVSVVGAFELVLDDHGAVVAVLGVDVEAEVADPHFGGDDGQSHFEGVGEDVDVFGEPGCEVAGFGGPH
ncbi:hypothetical protein [Rhodococcus opacus]|uniref:hypothetical protein n=1 Tax=Rhodococcus opacus TaxID=37919 RepID=UPI00217E7652|nr:hypothetical protein [Rhodococcus opacus]